MSFDTPRSARRNAREHHPFMSI
ncbi:uncharacterized protein METZ01_LOCUS233119, partial [marine metagenome]